MKLNKECEDLILGLTSMITCKYPNKPSATATCFFCRTNSNKIILITNRHVLSGCKSFALKITSINKLNNLTEIIDYAFNVDDGIRCHPFYDIATLDISDIYSLVDNINYIPQLTQITENAILIDYSKLPIFQEIIMLGYPNGIINSETNHPIIRTGYTATNIKETYNGQEVFLTDIPTFGGSSGSPILIPTKTGDISLIGINFQTYTQSTPVYSAPKRLYHKEKLVGRVSIPNDIGIAVNSIIIKEMIDYYNQ